MGLLKEATNQMAFFKCGMFGNPGSGKTYTASLLAIGICKAINNEKVAYFDTETGSDFMLPKLRAEGLKPFVLKSRAFTDLVNVIKECQKSNVGVLIIDSITHVWRDLCESYKKKLNRRKLQFQDWDTVKNEWQKYTDLFVNSGVHIIVCGRAGYEYDYDMNEDGTKDLIKTGTKMKVESEFGFEPSLMIEMERVTPEKDEVAELQEMSNVAEKRKKKQLLRPKIGSKWIHRAHVLKDRSDTLNGESFDYPTFENFRPHFEFLNIGGEHFGVDTSRNSQDRFDQDGSTQWKRERTRAQIALEEIKAEIDKVMPSSSANEKKAKINISKHVFGTASGTALEGMEYGMLEKGLARIRTILSIRENTIEAMANNMIQEPPPEDIPDFREAPEVAQERML